MLLGEGTAWSKRSLWPNSRGYQHIKYLNIHVIDEHKSSIIVLIS